MNKIKNCIVALFIISIQYTFQLNSINLKSIKNSAKDKLINTVVSDYKKKINNEIENDYYSNKKGAKIRLSSSINKKEEQYIKARMKKIKDALEKLLPNYKEKIDFLYKKGELPRIAFCGSGGGYRAMIATLGAFYGAQESNIVNTVLYNAGLSGSTFQAGRLC